MTRYTKMKLAVPAIALAAALIAGLAAIPYYGVARLDAGIRERQEKLVERNIAFWIADVEFSLTAWTIWDESIAKIDNRFDPEWADRNIGKSLIGTSRTRFAAIVDPGNSIIYSRTAEEVEERPFFKRGPERIVQDAASLVAQVRERELQPRPAGIPSPISFSKVEVFGSDAVLLTASLFQPDFRTSVPKGSRAPLLVSAIPIAGSLQQFLGDRFLLDDATIGSPTTLAPERARVSIAVAPDGQAEVLSWRPPTPARDLFIQSLPLAAMVGLVLIVAGIIVVRVSRSAVGSLMEAERQMRLAAEHDFLTGLLNRSTVEVNFASMAASSDVAVACLDLDGFKSVNDRCGHGAGDQLLKDVADRLRSGVRDEDVVFRLGGDEFAILMPSVTIGQAELRCRQLLALLSKPYQIDGEEVVIGASFGIDAVAARSFEPCDRVLRRADRALYRTKAAGRGGVSIYSDVETPQMDCA